MGLLRDVPVRGGDNRRVVVLKIQGMSETVTVGQEGQEAASNRASTSFGVKLSDDQLDGAVGRSGRAGAPAQGDGGPERDYPRRQLRRHAAAAEIADQVGARHARSVRGREPEPGRYVRRSDHGARHRSDSRRLQRQRPRQRARARETRSPRRRAPTTTSASASTWAAR